MLGMSRPEYSELELECRQKVRSKNYFAQVSNSTTKFLSVKGLRNARKFFNMQKRFCKLVGKVLKKWERFYHREKVGKVSKFQERF